MWTARVFTLYPEIFPGPLNKGLYGKALEKKVWNLEVVNIRDSAEDKHKTVDDTPFGGGSGMLLKPDILGKSIDANVKKSERIFYLSPKGKKFDQRIAKDLSKEKTVNLVCGHFEGVDQRILDTRNIEEISIGDYILRGGETAAFVLIDAVVRLIPGVIGDESSALSDSFQDNVVSAPIYTRPADYKGLKVPDVLISGNQKEIEKWKDQKSIERTKLLRPNLFDNL